MATFSFQYSGKRKNVSRLAAAHADPRQVQNAYMYGCDGAEQEGKP